MSGAAGQILSGPVRVVSDLHLAHAASGIKEVSLLRPIIEGASRIVFNGDTCEQSYAGWREKGERMRSELVELCSSLGAEAIFLRGNHDPRISDCGWLTSRDGKVMITHGDLVLRNPSPWSREYLQRKRGVQALLRERGEGDGSLQARWEILQEINAALVPGEAALNGEESGGGVLRAVWPPERLYQILRVWAMMGANAEAFVERFAPECRVFLFGHFHRAAVFERGGRLYCNTGAYESANKAMVVDVNDDEVVIRTVVKGIDYRPGEIVKRQRL